MGLGDDEHGELALGAVGPTVTTPTASASSLDFVAVAGGFDHSCGIAADGLYCWGSLTEGRLGNGVTTSGDAPLPMRIDAGEWREVSAGGVHTCAIDAARALYCWGQNTDGRIGVAGAPNPTLRPTRVLGPDPWLTVSAGSNATCAIAVGGALYCWGSNAGSILGIGEPDESVDVEVPTRVCVDPP